MLIQVIAQLVARGEWDVNFAGVGQPPRTRTTKSPPYLLKPNQLNSLGYYPVANALIVRATGRYHPSQSFKLPMPGRAGCSGRARTTASREAGAAAERPERDGEGAAAGRQGGELDREPGDRRERADGEGRQGPEEGVERDVRLGGDGPGTGGGRGRVPVRVQGVRRTRPSR